MSMNEREAQEFVRPLEALPAIEGRVRDRRRRRRRHPVRLAVVIGAIGILGTGSAVAAIEKLSRGSEASLTREQHRLKRISEASDQGINREVQERSGGSISPSEVEPGRIRRAVNEQLEREFPNELRFYDGQHKLVHVTKCSWPHPNPDCVDPIEAVESYRGAKIVETWSNGKPIGGGS